MYLFVVIIDVTSYDCIINYDIYPNGSLCTFPGHVAMILGESTVSVRVFGSTGYNNTMDINGSLYCYTLQLRLHRD